MGTPNPEPLQQGDLKSDLPDYNFQTPVQLTYK